MPNIRLIKNFETFKSLADPRRLHILKLLMDAPATISQLGEKLGEHPAWVRHHVKQLEKAGLVEIDEVRVVGGYVEKYYRSRAGAFVFHQMILPQSAAQNALVMLGSDDPAINLLAGYLREVDARFHLLVLPVGSLDGLVALRQGLAQLSGCHLLDWESGEYNRSYVRHFFPDCSTYLVTLAQREQGLLVAPGNPLSIKGLEDLAGGGVRLVNRNRGSGTRLWLDKQLERGGIQAESIQGYRREVTTHSGVARAILENQADAGVALSAVARQHGLGFIPLFQERYDLVIPAEQYATPQVRGLLSHMRDKRFRKNVAALSGYRTEMMGEEMQICA
jgi:putative molybdopterin biosynthesis protein